MNVGGRFSTGVGVCVRVGVRVGVGVVVPVAVSVGVAVPVRVSVGVAEGVSVGVRVRLTVVVREGVAVSVTVTLASRSGVSVRVRSAVGVFVSVAVALELGRGDGEVVGVVVGRIGGTAVADGASGDPVGGVGLGARPAVTVAIGVSDAVGDGVVDAVPVGVRVRTSTGALVGGAFGGEAVATATTNTVKPTAPSAAMPIDPIPIKKSRISQSTSSGMRRRPAMMTLCLEWRYSDLPMKRPGAIAISRARCRSTLRSAIVRRK